MINSNVRDSLPLMVFLDMIASALGPKIPVLNDLSKQKTWVFFLNADEAHMILTIYSRKKCYGIATNLED